MNVSAARKVMVDSQVRVNDVTDRALQAALLTTDRHLLCAPDRAFSAYAEVEVPIVPGRSLMMARDVAKLIQAAQPRAGERALAIAAPYAAAVLARLGLQVTAQEGDSAVFEVIGAGLGDDRIETVTAPLNTPTGQDWDLIISEGAVPGRPEAWLQALRTGGRLLVVERAGAAGKAVLYVKGREGVSRRELFDSNPPLLAEMMSEPHFAL